MTKRIPATLTALTALLLGLLLALPAAPVRAAALTDFAENKIVDWLLRGEAIGITGASAGAGTGISNLYFGLLTGACSDSSAGTEVSGGSYARVTYAGTTANWAGTQSAGSTTASTGTGGTTSNNNAITYPAPTANWGSVVGVGAWDAVTAGNQVICTALTIPKTINNGDAAPSFAPASYTFQQDN